MSPLLLRLVIVAAVGAFVVSWQLGLWLFVVAIPYAALMVFRNSWRHPAPGRRMERDGDPPMTAPAQPALRPRSGRRPKVQFVQMLPTNEEDGMRAVMIRPGSPRSSTRSDLVAMLAGMVVFGAMTVVVVPTLRLPVDVDRVTIVNAHTWNADVDVTGSKRDGWVGLGTLDRESEQTFYEVMDQGDRWIFRFSYGGEAVEMELERALLEREGWKVAVPPRFAERMLHAGVAQSAQ